MSILTATFAFKPHTADATDTTATPRVKRSRRTPHTSAVAPEPRAAFAAIFVSMANNRAGRHWM